MRMRILSSSSKPMSSPGRTDIFPPPLMRFLRSDKSSRSRGRSKTSTTKNPLFFRKKKSINSSTNSIETTQEPSSPKVTCIGQVRVRRSKNKSRIGKSLKKPPNPRKYTNYNLCCWSRRPNWNWKWKWLWSWVLLDCCSVSVRTASTRHNNGGFGSFDEEKKRRQEGEIVKRRFEMRRFVDDDVFERGRRSSASEMGTVSTITPKNALFLTRSRSASLASRFWDEEETGEFGEEGNGGLRETGRRSSASEMGTISTAKMPPENGLVLTRSASLAQRFWGEEGRNKRGMRDVVEEDSCETGRRSSASERGTTATLKAPPRNGLLLKRCTSLVKRLWGEESRVMRRMQDLDEEDLGETGRRSSASEMGTTGTMKAPPQNALVLVRCKSSSLASRFWGEEGEEGRNASRMRDLENGDDFCEPGRSSLSEIEASKSPPRNALLLTRSRSSSANRFWGEERAETRPMPRFEEEDLCETGRTSSASEMGTAATSKAPPKKELLPLAYRFWGEAGERGMRHSEEEDFCEVGRRSSASEIGTTATTKAPPKNALLLTRSRSSTLRSRFQCENEEEMGNKGFEKEIMRISNRDFPVEWSGNRGSKFSENECGELNLTAVKNEGKLDKEGGKVSSGREFNKLRRCKSEPARRDPENFDPQKCEFNSLIME